MDDPNITMEEYIRLEEEKARRRGKVYNWETATYATLLCEPTVSSLNNDEIDFIISFDEFDDEDCTTVYTAYTNRMDMAYPNRMDTAYRLSGRYPAVTFCASIRTYSLNNTTYTVINTAYHGPIRRIHQGRYGVSVPALTKDHRGISPIRRIQRDSIRRIQDIVFEYSGRYQAWSLLQEIPNTPYPTLGYARRKRAEESTTVINSIGDNGDLDNSTNNVLIPLDSWTSGLLVYKLPLSVIMEYLVKISKKARILELKRRNMKIVVLTSNTPYPSRKIRRICACTSQKTTKETRSIRRLRKKYCLNLKNGMPPRDKMDNPNITMEEYIRLEEEKAHRHGMVYNWETAKVSFDESNDDDYTVKGYTKEIEHDFEQRHEMIFERQVNRVHLLDFEGLTPDMRQDLAVRLRMVYTRDDGQEVFVSHAWRRLFEIRAPLVHEFLLDFFSTCRIGSLHTTEEMAKGGFEAYWLGSERVIPDKGDLSGYWIEISLDRDFLRSAPSYTYIRDLHGLRGSQGPLFISIVLVLASDDGLRGLSVVTRELSLIDMGELIKLTICMEVGDNWAWVALEEKRQPVAVSAAPGDVEECAQRRLEEEIQGLRQDVRSLQGLMKRPMTDQGRFSTWMVSCMMQLMKASGRTYQAFDGIFRGSYPENKPGRPCCKKIDDVSVRYLTNLEILERVGV
ncbi:hypothetical protein Tco_0968421 [Tanacetum coccineum]